MDENLLILIKCLVLTLLMLTTVPVMVWVERRGSAFMQLRLGPNRVGPFGLLQFLPDGLKFFFKEDVVPGHVRKFYYILAPTLTMIPALITFSVIPIADTLILSSGQIISFQVAHLNVGILFVFALASISVYGILIGGWASNNKFSLLGSLRSSCQMISYELSLGLSIVGILMIFSSLELNDLVRSQGQTLFHIGPWAIPKWGVIVQPLGFLLFLISTYAETNRLPFDLPEGESELIAGYHLEYGSMKFAMFFMAEYCHMFTAAGLVVSLFFGGWQLLPGFEFLLNQVNSAFQFSEEIIKWTRVLFQTGSFFIKIAFFMWLYVWVRWTLPRFRYDQLMDLGWKVMFPLALANIFVTGLLIAWGVL